MPVFVLTGEDPLKRPDLFELIEYAKQVGVRVSLTPSATPLLTRDVVHRLKQSGLARLAVSLDGAHREVHDAFRGMSGSFDRTMEAIEWANEAGLPVQINTTFSRRNADFDQTAQLVASKQIALWSVFFLVPTGRAKLDELLSADEFEALFAKRHQLSRRDTFHIKTREAQRYRRYLLQQQAAGRRSRVAPAANVREKIQDTIGRAPRGLNDGKGFVFVSHTGEVFPSGFLPFSGGSVRSESLSRIYRESPIFQRLRDPDQLGGKCGACEYRHICGGSHARANALTGDPLAEESPCAYTPKNYCASDALPPSHWRKPSALHVTLVQISV